MRFRPTQCLVAIQCSHFIAALSIVSVYHMHLLTVSFIFRINGWKYREFEWLIFSIQNIHAHTPEKKQKRFDVIRFYFLTQPRILMVSLKHIQYGKGHGNKQREYEPLKMSNNKNTQSVIKNAIRYSILNCVFDCFLFLRF